MSDMEKVVLEESGEETQVLPPDAQDEEPMVLEEIELEELYVDGICGVY